MVIRRKTFIQNFFLKFAKKCFMKNFRNFKNSQSHITTVKRGPLRDLLKLMRKVHN
jgi:hypothetical protein